MPKAKKRLSKKARAAIRILNDSKLLASKSDRDLSAGEEFNSSAVTSRPNTKAIKPRPDKKRG